MSQALVSAARVELFLGMKEVGSDGKSLIGTGQFHREEQVEPKGAGEINVKDATIYWQDPQVPLEDKTSEHGHESGVSDLGSTIRGDSSHGGGGSDKGSDAESGSPALNYPKAILKNVTLRVGPGELCAVVGRVASGKSTLCSAILNEALIESGEVTLKGKVAYAAQTPWILNATLRENILFGAPMDQVKYDRVLKACQLEHDLDLLDDGDLTEIGERGINLSGGQKQRISVARAAYADADTVIFDDPLSALDPEVGQKLFEECILTLLKGKTRLFVTNQLQFLQYCDSVVALGGRRVLEQGTYRDLMSEESSGEVKRLLTKLEKARADEKQEDPQKKTSSNEKKASSDAKAKVSSPTKQIGAKEKEEAPASPAKPKEVHALTTKEERNVGAISFSVYLKYMVAGGGYLKFFLVYCCFILTCCNQLAASYWVSFWTSDPKYEKHSQAFYLGIYFMLACTLGLVTFNSTFNLVRFTNYASETIHKDLLASIFRAPQSFFDTTPLGRILSRFSKDLNSVDLEVGESLDFFAFASLTALFSLTTIIVITPWFGVAVIPLAFFYFRVMNYFRDVSRETKRLDSISRSPVYALFSEVSAQWYIPITR
jgi:ATP-binding cassette, subfamily C (CFTR/MRP), member 1